MKFKDQIGHTIILKETPKRIISLVPSQSEFLWDIGLRKELVGITKFCIHPDEMYRSIERVGGTKDLNIEKIRALKPDLIIGNKEENDEVQIKLLQKEFNVWMSDIITINNAIEMMQSLGLVLEKESQVAPLLIEVESSISSIKNLFPSKTVAYFMWNEPFMLAANKTFINSIIEHMGLKNVVEEKERYPMVTNDELINLNPNYCFLSSEPFPFKQKHMEELKNILPNSKIILVDGEMFSWYGSRLKLLENYVYLLHKELS